MKECFKCHQSKPLSEFYAHVRMADGHLNKCKECTKRDTAERALELSRDPQWLLLERMRHRLKSAKARLEGAATRLTKEQRAAVHKRYSEKHPEKRAAQQAVGNAIRDGRLFKQPCEKCGELKVQAHHDDYSKPLDVRWLCIPHHNQHHIEERERALLQNLQTA